MNSNPALCLKCEDKVPQLTLKENNTKVEIKCKCGEDKTMTLKEYLQLLKEHPNRIGKYKHTCATHTDKIAKYYCFHCKSYDCEECRVHSEGYDISGNDSTGYSTYIPKLLNFDPIQMINDIKNLLNFDFPSLKDKYLSSVQDKEKQNKFNKVYETEFNRYQDLLSFLEILQKNNNGNDYTIVQNMNINFDFKVTKFSGDFSENNLINYLEKNAFSKYYNSFTSEKIGNFFCKYLLLEDGRLIASNGDHFFYIIDPYNNYHIDFKFKCGTFNFEMKKFDSGNIAIGTRVEDENIDGVLLIYKIYKDNAECLLTIKNIGEPEFFALPNNRLALRYDKSTVFYDFSKEYTDKPVHTIDIPEKMAYMWYSNGQNIIIRRADYCHFLVWDQTTYNRLLEMEKFFEKDVDGQKGVYLGKEILDDIFICYWMGYIGILNLKQRTLDTIDYSGNGFNDCILLRDSQTVLIVDTVLNYYELNLEKKTIVKRTFYHESTPGRRIVSINDHTFVIMEYDIIREWKY